MQASALIAEDEPLLALSLQAELAQLWPELRIVATVGHGAAAVEAALRLHPQVVFLDIRMPGMSGLEAAEAIAEDWPDGIAAPLIVFVTAYDQYALEAFRHAAVDYLLKPVDPVRLAQTCSRARAALQQRRDDTSGSAPDWDAALGQLRRLLAAPSLDATRTHAASDGIRASGSPKLQVIQAATGNAIHLIPIGDVVYFEAADKYVRVITTAREHLIRASLRDLLPQIDDERFWQVHRGTVVRADAIAAAMRDDAGKITLQLRGRPEQLVVSRLYAHRFKAM